MVAAMTAILRAEAVPIARADGSRLKRRHSVSRRRSVADVLCSLWTEAVDQLLQIEAARLHWLVPGVVESLGEIRTFVGPASAHDGHWLALSLALGADDPIDRAGRKLCDELVGSGVPDDRPADGPAVAGAHFAAVDEMNAAAVDVHIVHQKAGRPALVRLDSLIA